MYQHRQKHQQKIVPALGILVLLVFDSVAAWSTLPARRSPNNDHGYKNTHQNLHHAKLIYPSHTYIFTKLFGGIGTATTYSWKEEQFEMEVTISVPPNTTAKDIKFKCSSHGIDLRLLSKDDERILLDGSRNTRGKICVDGTFWSICDGAAKVNGEKQREINVVIEKHFVPASSAGGVMTYDQLTDFDWGGLYPDDEVEVTFRQYDEAEELNVRDYAAKLGVDIDNIDMSKVDKTMFGAGLRQDAESAMDFPGEKKVSDTSPGSQLNITQATLDQLVKYGLAKEVVRQGDGTEYEMNAFSENLERKSFSMLGKDVSVDELRNADVVDSSVTNLNRNEESKPNAADDELLHEERVQASDHLAHSSEESEANDEKVDPNAKDPIEKLTVKKLKEILRQEVRHTYLFTCCSLHNIF